MDEGLTKFVIISGEYSDWNIEGYADSEYEAIQICAEHNQSKAPNSCGWYYEWYYDKVKKLSGPKTEIKLIYVHNFLARVENSMLVLDDSSRNIEFFTEKDKMDELDTKIACTIPLMDGHKTWIHIPLKKLDYEKARKIAQDKIAEFNYEYAMYN